MIRGENSEALPKDLVIKILSRLHAKSIARFRCLSKPWGSMLGSPYFTDLFLSRSSARPRLLFAVKQSRDWCFLTSPQPQNLYDKSSSLVVTVDLHMSFIGDDTWLDFCGHNASGLVCFCPRSTISEEDKHDIVICNPSTGQFASLPLPKGSVESYWRPFLGYDPIGNQSKVLCISHPSYGEENPYQIFTLGTANDCWRKIHCPLDHYFIYRGEGICINGVLYYFAEQMEGMSMIVCFDVRSETFTFIYKDFICKSPRDSPRLINYKGQLGVITLKYNYIPARWCSRDLCMWVMDVEKPKPEWWEYVYHFRGNQEVGCDCSAFLEDEIFESFVDVVGVTASGDVVLSTDYKSPFYVFFLNPEKNSLQRVEIQGFGAADHGPFKGRSRRFKIFVDHIEDLKVMKTTYAETSISPPKTEA